MTENPSNPTDNATSKSNDTKAEDASTECLPKHSDHCKVSPDSALKKSVVDRVEWVLEYVALPIALLACLAMSILITSYRYFMGMDPEMIGFLLLFLIMIAFAVYMKIMKFHRPSAETKIPAGIPQGESDLDEHSLDSLAETELANDAQPDPEPREEEKPKQKRAKRTEEGKLREAAKLFWDNQYTETPMTQAYAEKAVGIPQGALSKGRGAEIMTDFQKKTSKAPPTIDVPRDIRRNEVEADFVNNELRRGKK